MIYLKYNRWLHHIIIKMTTSHSQAHEHHLIIEVQKGVNNIFIGQLREIPSIIVQAKTKQQLVKKIEEAFDAYFDAFPEEHDKNFPSQATPKNAIAEPERIPLSITIQHNKRK